MEIQRGERKLPLVVQGLRFCASPTGGMGSLVWELRSHIPHSAAKKKKKDKKPKVRQDIHLEMKKQMFDKQTFAGPCKDNATQRGL